MAFVLSRAIGEPADVINEQPKLIADSFILPDESLASVPGDLRFTEVRR